MRKRLFALLTALLLTTVLLGNGAMAPFAAAEAGDDGASVSIMAYPSTNEYMPDEEWYAFISEKTGVRVNFIPAPSDYLDNVTKQTTLLSSGDATVDIFHCDEPMLSTFMNAGFLEPITDAVSEDIADFPQAYIEAMCSKDGEVYAIPTEVQPVLLFANRELFEQAGLSYPTNEQEFIEVAQALTSGDVYGYGAAWTKGFMYNCIERWMYAFDGDFFDWNNENSKKAVKFMYDCVNTYKITPMAVLGDEYDALNQKMADGKYAMMFQWQYVTGIFRDAGVYGDGGPIEIIDIPAFANNKSLTGGWNFVMSKASQNKEAAKKVMAFLASPESQVVYGTRSSQIPANGKALSDETLQQRIPGLDRVLHYIDNIPLLPRPTHGRINEMIDSVETIMQMYLTDAIDFDTCIKNAQSEIDRLLA